MAEFKKWSDDVTTQVNDLITTVKSLVRDNILLTERVYTLEAEAKETNRGR